MSDFVQTMKDWRRMCSAMRSCDECPMNEVKCWAESPSDLIDSFERRESVITEWAAEHPVVYPTWGEWLQEMGVMTDIHDRLNNYKQVMEVCGIPLYSIPTVKVLRPIPADIAEKLGIEPKEG